MKKLSSFAYSLPLLELLLGVVTVLALTLLFFFRLKRMAHGAQTMSLSSGQFQFTVPSSSFLSLALMGAGSLAEKQAAVLDTPAKFVEALVSVLVTHKTNWYPASFAPSIWRALVYPIYALPAWSYIGMGIDAGRGRRIVRGWNAGLSAVLAVTCGILFCGFRFGITAEERHAQELLSWYIAGLALWAILFSIPLLAWALRRKQNTKP